MRIIKFEKNDCNPCKTVSELLNKKGVTYESINAFDQPMIAGKYKVRSVPTIIVLDDNDKEIHRIIGLKVEEINKL